MQFLKKVKSKKVISIVLVFIVSFCTIFTKPTKTYAQESKIKIEMTNQNIDNKGVDKMRSEFITINNKSYKAKKMRVTASAYTSSVKEGGSLTYLGTKCRDGVIAVDPKVIPLHSKVYIPSLNKVFIAEDVGSSIKNNKIDIWMNSYQKAMQWGLKQIDIYILE